MSEGGAESEEGAEEEALCYRPTFQVVGGWPAPGALRVPLWSEGAPREEASRDNRVFAVVEPGDRLGDGQRLYRGLESARLAAETFGGRVTEVRPA